MAYTTQDMRDDVEAMVLSAEQDMLHGPFDYADFHLILPVMTDAGILFDRGSGGVVGEHVDAWEPTAYQIGNDSVCEIEVADAFKILYEQVRNASTAQVKLYAVWLSGCINRGCGCEMYEETIED